MCAYFVVCPVEGIKEPRRPRCKRCPRFLKEPIPRKGELSDHGLMHDRWGEQIPRSHGTLFSMGRRSDKWLANGLVVGSRGQER